MSSTSRRRPDQERRAAPRVAFASIISVELLELISNHFAGHRHIPAVTLHTFLSLFAQDEAHELFDSRVDRLSGIAIEEDIDVMRERIGVVANRLESARHIGATGTRLDGQHPEVWGQGLG